MSQPVAVAQPVRLWLRLEALVIFAVTLVVYHKLSGDWVRFAVLFLIPDLSMLGYLAGPRVGAWCYNAAHTTLGPLAVLGLVALWVISLTAIPYAIMWAAHIALDRALGFGLKYPTAFGDTHLSTAKRKPAAAAVAAEQAS